MFHEKVPQRRFGLECLYHEDQFTIEDVVEARKEDWRQDQFQNSAVPCRSRLVVLQKYEAARPIRLLLPVQISGETVRADKPID